MINTALGYGQEPAARGGSSTQEGTFVPGSRALSSEVAGHNFKTATWEHAQYLEEVDS